MPADMKSATTPKRSVKLTQSVVERAPIPPAGQAIYRDSELKGFGLRVTSGGARTYVVEKRISGRVRRVKIGRADALKAEKARRLAQEFLGIVAGGRDPIAEKAAVKARTITLGEALDSYLVARGDKLKPRTREQYRDVITTRRKDGSPLAFADWRNKRIADITAELVQRRHRELSDGHGPAWANLAMRVLRLLINYASMRSDDGSGKPLIATNPVSRLGQARLWNDVGRRETILRIEDMPAWHEGLTAISEIGRDYLLFVLLTGLRRREATALKWADVDINKTRTLTVQTTKNSRAHVLPLSRQLLDILARRRATTDGPFVFPGRKAGTCVAEVKTLTQAVAKACGVRTSVHDLRRTFATTAERLDISSYAVKRLLNHTTGNDVTAGYIVTDVERLRRPMQAISDFLLQAMALAGSNVLPMRNAVRGAP
jgi:integrase